MNKSLKDTYKDYKSSTKDPVDKQVYLKIAAEYMKFLLVLVLDGEEVTLPEKLGTLSIKGKKEKVRTEKVNGEIVIKGLAPNWPKTWQLRKNNPEARKKRKIVYHTNAHTNGIRYRYLWRKLNVTVTNKTLYSLVMTRTNKREASARIKNNKEYLLIRK